MRKNQPLFLGYLMILFLIVIFFWPSVLKAQNRYAAVALTGKAPHIDGKLEAIWNSAPWSGGFTQFEPYNGKAPSEQTTFKILYDNNNLYVAIRCYDDEPDKIEKRLSRRDNFEGDWVAIAIDSYNDNLTAFAFSSNALGVKGDVKFSNDDHMDMTWDAVWYLKTSIDSLGWVAEMRIPFTQLRFTKNSTHEWGIQLIRSLFRKQETSVWNPVSKEESGWVSHFGTLTGIDNIKPKKEVELIPYVMANLEKSPKEEGNPFATGSSRNYSLGLDGKVAVTNNFTLNFTLNPDFGQVEADPSEVNLTAFETYFEEKRPFFIEGNNIFNFPLSAANNNFNRENLFYSRRIGRTPHYYPDLSENEFAKINKTTRILGAFKFSGKTDNGWSIGVMEALTNREIGIVDSAKMQTRITVEPLTNFFNARIQKDLNGGNTIIGGMVTATNRMIKDSTVQYLPSAAYTGGMDFTRYWKNRAYRLSIKSVFSRLSGSQEALLNLQESPQRYYQRPDNFRQVDSSLKILQGSGGSMEIAKNGEGHWRYGFRASWISPGLELNDQGYLRIADIIKQSTWMGYEIWEPFSIFRKMSLYISQWTGWDFRLHNTFCGLNFSTQTQFKNYWSLSYNANLQSYELMRHELRGGPSLTQPGGWFQQINFSSNQSKKLSVGGNFGFGKGYQQTQKSLNTGINFNYQPLPYLKISMEPSYNYSENQLIYVDTFEEKSEITYLTASIIRTVLMMNIRVNVSLTPDLSIQYWGQPYLFSGDYSHYKKVVHPDQRVFDSQFYVYPDNQISFDNASNTYTVDSNGNGVADFTFDNPDFSFVAYRSNLVIRWEYKPGAALYVVWSQGRSGDSSVGSFHFNSNWNLMSGSPADNVFLVKFTYRFSL